MLEALEKLIGSPPAGLEFIEYFVLVGFVVASIYFVYKVISIIFSFGCSYKCMDGSFRRFYLSV